MHKFITASVLLNGDAVVIVYHDDRNNKFGYYTHTTDRRGEALSQNKYFDSVEDAEKQGIKELQELGY